MLGLASHPNYLEMLSREYNKNLIRMFLSVYILGGVSASLEGPFEVFTKRRYISIITYDL